MSELPIQNPPDHELPNGEAPRTHDDCVRRALFVFGACGTAPVLLGAVVAQWVAESPGHVFGMLKILCIIGLITVPALALIGCVLESVFFVETLFPDNSPSIFGEFGPVFRLLILGMCPPTLFIAAPFYFGYWHRKTALMANRPQWNYLTAPSLMASALTVFLVKDLISLYTWVTLLILLSPFVSDIIMTNWVIKYRRLKLLAKPTRQRFQFSLRTLLFGIWMLGAYVSAFILLLRE